MGPKGAVVNIGAAHGPQGHPRAEQPGTLTQNQVGFSPQDRWFE